MDRIELGTTPGFLSGFKAAVPVGILVFARRSGATARGHTAGEPWPIGAHGSVWDTASIQRRYWHRRVELRPVDTLPWVGEG